MSEQLHHGDGLTVLTTATVTDFRALGKWVGGVGSDDQVEFLAGLASVLTSAPGGLMQLAYIGTAAREAWLSCAIHELACRLADYTEESA